MLIPYTVSVFIYIVVLMIGTITTILYFFQNPAPKSKAIFYFKKFLSFFLIYVATDFLYTIMAFGNNQTGIFELSMFLSDLAYFAFTIYWILILKELTQAVFLKNIRIFILATVVYAIIFEPSLLLSAFQIPSPVILDPLIKLANFFYLFLVTAAALFYFIVSLWMPKSKKRLAAMGGSLLLILYPVSELPWMVFVGLIQKTSSDITVRFDLILFLYFFFCIFWLYQRTGSQKPPAFSLEEHGLTKRESEICRLVAKGLSNPEIASQLSISENTVKRHLNNCFRKLEVKSRYELIVRISGLSDDK